LGRFRGVVGDLEADSTFFEDSSAGFEDGSAGFEDSSARLEDASGAAVVSISPSALQMGDSACLLSTVADPPGSEAWWPSAEVAQLSADDAKLWWPETAGAMTSSGSEAAFSEARELSWAFGGKLPSRWLARDVSSVIAPSPVSIPAVASMSRLALSASVAAAVAAEASEPVVVAEAASDPSAAVVLMSPDSATAVEGAPPGPATAVEEWASGRLLLLFLESCCASPASAAASAWLSFAGLWQVPQTDSIKVPNSVLSRRSAAEEKEEFDESDEEEGSISLDAKPASLSEGGCEGSTGEGYSHRPATSYSPRWMYPFFLVISQTVTSGCWDARPQHASRGRQFQFLWN